MKDIIANHFWNLANNSPRFEPPKNIEQSGSISNCSRRIFNNLIRFAEQEAKLGKTRFRITVEVHLYSRKKIPLEKRLNDVVVLLYRAGFKEVEWSDGECIQGCREKVLFSFSTPGNIYPEIDGNAFISLADYPLTMDPVEEREDEAQKKKWQKIRAGTTPKEDPGWVPIQRRDYFDPDRSELRRRDYEWERQ